MINRVIAFFKKHSLIDFFRKVLFKLFKSLHSLLQRVYNAYRFKNWSVNTGRNVLVDGQIYDIHIGKNTFIYDNCIFAVSSESSMRIGDRVVLSYGVLIGCRQSIIIGDDVQIGEYTSIRDSTHRYDVFDKAMKYAPDISAAIVIGDNVWIGRGCLIQPGTVIESGVVVAANSVVKGRLEKNGIYGGAPAKLIKFRQE